MRRLLFLAAITVGACSAPCDNMHFERLREADRAVITVGTGRPYAEIRSRDKLAALVEFAEAHSSDWGEPWYGAPVAKLYGNFYAGDRFLGDLGGGPNFLSAQGCAFFQSRGVTPSDRKTLIAPIGVNPDAEGTK